MKNYYFAFTAKAGKVLCGVFRMFFVFRCFEKNLVKNLKLS